MSKRPKKQRKPLKCNTSESQQQEPIVVIEPLTENPLPSSETLPSTGLRQTGTSTTQNFPVRSAPHSPVRSAPHSPMQSLPHSPVRSSPLARPSTPAFSHPTSPVIISSPELTSALSNLKQRYPSLRLPESMYKEKQQNIQRQKSFEESEAGFIINSVIKNFGCCFPTYMLGNGSQKL